jgi:hypothetical protein
MLISANADLFEACEILSEFGNIPPVKFLESFNKFKENVSNMPFMFPKYNNKPKYRKAALAYDYLAFYQVDKKNKAIKIHRILYGKSNIGDLL